MYPEFFRVRKGKLKMYGIGDKIVYPLHGAGVIEAIEERVIMGKKQQYYIMRINACNMTVMIPMDNCTGIGIRDIMTREEAKGVLEYFKNEPVHIDDNWNRRQRENLVRIKSGDIYQVACVLKELLFRDKSKGLSTSERKILNNAKQIIISELVMSEVATKEDIETILDEVVRALIKK